MTHKINHANIKEWAKNYTGEPFDAILCDPPYELGFMGKSWDSSGIAFDRDMWADLFRHIKPGGHLLAFSGSRTYHRMAVAIEDAGFEIRDMIEWIYGSGFPKSHNISKAIDKQAGAEREVVGERITGIGTGKGTTAIMGDGNRDITAPATPEAQQWDGYGTALKPAHEPCVLARKPLEKGMTVATNALKHGTGGLNIDGSRVASELPENRQRHGGGSSDIFPERGNNVTMPSGRFPANLIHDGSDEVVEVFPNDSQRFFYTAKASKSERNAGLEGFEEKDSTARQVASEWKVDVRSPEGGYMTAPQTKATNHHPTVKPLSLTKYLATLIKPPTSGRLLVPFSGSGSEMIGALQAGWEYVEGVELTEEYIPIAEARIKYWTDKISSEQTELL